MLGYGTLRLQSIHVPDTPSLDISFRQEPRIKNPLELIIDHARRAPILYVHPHFMRALIRSENDVYFMPPLK